jgi:hypothetical protein
MKILKNGTAIRAVAYNLFGETNVVVAVASVTFSGVSITPRIGVNIDWKHAGTGIERLDLQFEGIPAPAGSSMVRNQLSVTAGVSTRQDRSDPGFTVADLVGILVGTFYQCAAYALCDRGEHNDPTYVLTEGYAQDGTIIVNDIETWSTRQGRWNQIIDGFTVLTVTVASGRSQIGINSHIQGFSA